MMMLFRRIYSDVLKIQHDSSQSHCVRETVKLLYIYRELPDFITLDFWPTNSPDLNAVD